MKLNRETRRKQAIKIANNVIKGRSVALEQKQWGLGLVITNKMVAIIFLKWSWTPWDRRGK